MPANFTSLGNFWWSGDEYFEFSHGVFIILSKSQRYALIKLILLPTNCNELKSYTILWVVWVFEIVLYNGSSSHSTAMLIEITNVVYFNIGYVEINQIWHYDKNTTAELSDISWINDSYWANVICCHGKVIFILTVKIMFENVMTHKSCMNVFVLLVLKHVCISGVWH